MNMFEFHIYDEPKRHRYFRYGSIKRIIYKNGDIIIGDQDAVRKANKPRLAEDANNIEKFVIETHYQKKPIEPFPNFLQIRFALECVDDKAMEFLDLHNISYNKVPAEIMNETDREYSVVFFNLIPGLLDLSKSNLYINDNGFAVTNNRNAFYPGESKIVLKGRALELRGIFMLNELRTLICDEEAKVALERSGLTGFRFEELEVSGN